MKRKRKRTDWRPGNALVRETEMSNRVAARIMLLRNKAEQLHQAMQDVGIGRYADMELDQELGRMMTLLIACRHFARKLREVHGREAN